MKLDVMPERKKPSDSAAHRKMEVHDLRNGVSDLKRLASWFMAFAEYNVLDPKVDQFS